MPKSILILLLLLPTLVLGQATVEVTREYQNPYIKEVYHVQKADNSTREGSYQKIGYTGIVLEDGFYKNGLKDSLWTEYQRGENNTTWPKAKGAYAADHKVGIWEFYNSKGELEQQYDYSKNEIAYFKLEDKEKNKVYRVLDGKGKTKAKLDRPPLYIGGSAMMWGTVLRNVRYPRDAQRRGISGEVRVAFTIDNEGKTADHRVIKGIGYGCDEEALRVVKAIPDAWLPGILNGQAVPVEYVVPIRFFIKN